MLALIFLMNIQFSFSSLLMYIYSNMIPPEDFFSHIPFTFFYIITNYFCDLFNHLTILDFIIKSLFEYVFLVCNPWNDYYFYCIIVYKVCIYYFCLFIFICSISVS